MRNSGRIVPGAGAMARATGVSPGSSLAEGSIEPSKAPSSVTTATGPLQSVTSAMIASTGDGDRRLDVVDDPTVGHPREPSVGSPSAVQLARPPTRS